jgi:hypothetical protein
MATRPLEVPTAHCRPASSNRNAVNSLPACSTAPSHKSPSDSSLREAHFISIVPASSQYSSLPLSPLSFTLQSENRTAPGAPPSPPPHSLARSREGTGRAGRPFPLPPPPPQLSCTLQSGDSDGPEAPFPLPPPPPNSLSPPESHSVELTGLGGLSPFPPWSG